MTGIDCRRPRHTARYRIEAHKDNFFFGYVKTNSVNFTIFFHHVAHRRAVYIKIPTFRYFVLWNDIVILHRIIIQEAIVLNVKTGAASVCENRCGAVTSYRQALSGRTADIIILT